MENLLIPHITCAVCHSLLSEPKLLACSHTFCKECLVKTLFSSNIPSRSLPCPSCRHPTDVADGDVSNLPPNLPIQSIILGIRDDGKRVQTSDNKNCSKIGCDDEYTPNSPEITRNTCQLENNVEGGVVCDGPCNEDVHELTDFCMTCNKYISFRCRILHHNEHIVKSTVQYKSHQHQCSSPKSGINCESFDTITKHDEHTSKVNKQGELNGFVALQSRIEQNCQDSINALKERKAVLIAKFEVENKNTSSFEKVDNLIDKSGRHHDSVVIDCILLNGIQKGQITADVLLKGTYHERDKPSPDELSTKSVVKWREKKKVPLHTKCSMECLAATASDQVIVGYSPGGVEVFSSDGIMEEGALFDVKVRALGILSDGRCAVRDDSNALSLYTVHWEKLKVKFITLGREAGHGGVAVDSQDRIYVSYRDTRLIQGFSPSGGKPCKELPCAGYEPMQISTIGTRLVVKSALNSLRVIDDDGAIENELVLDRQVIVHASAGADGKILVARLGKGTNCVSILQYSGQLNDETTLVTDLNIELTDRKWFCLQAYSSGNLAFCTPNKLHVFSRS